MGLGSQSSSARQGAVMNIELRCNECRAQFPEAVDDEFCPECGGSSLFEREVFTDEKLIALARQRLAMDRDRV
jgi:rRNA maturation endonuclease Nob1